MQRLLLAVGERVHYCAAGYQAVGWVGLKGGFESGCNGCYWRFVSGFSTVLPVARGFEGGG